MQRFKVDSFNLRKLFSGMKFTGMFSRKKKQPLMLNGFCEQEATTMSDGRVFAQGLRSFQGFSWKMQNYLTPWHNALFFLSVFTSLWYLQGK